jgi:hypothetical protein
MNYTKNELIDGRPKSPPRETPHPTDTPGPDSVPKPLHVQVAEALGWTQTLMPNGMWPNEFFGYPPEGAIVGNRSEVPRYDTDWSATGPLIERLQIGFTAPGNIDRRSPVDAEDQKTWLWIAQSFTEKDQQPWYEIDGPTPLTAVCNLLLQLHKAGKLQP